MTAATTIRRATIDDAGSIARVHVQSWQQAYRNLLPGEYLAALSVPKREAKWSESIAAGALTVLVVEAESQVVGFSALGPCRDSGATAADYEIMAIYLAPGYWSTGRGRVLWLRSQEAMVAQGAARASLWVLADNERAIRFYRAAGFLPEVDAERTVELGGAPVRELRFARRLAGEAAGTGSSFSMNARQYNERTMKGLFRKIYPVIAQQAIARTGIRDCLCLDLGGGPGMLGICVAEASDLQVTIVDPLADCIELARGNIAERGLNHRVTATPGRAEALPLSDGVVDLVVSRGSIYFWDDQRQGLREIHRVLRPGGWAFVGGGFGTKALRDEILAEKADDPAWNKARSERGRKHPPEYFRALLAELAIDGVVDSGDEGMWIVFRKPEARP